MKLFKIYLRSKEQERKAEQRHAEILALLERLIAQGTEIMADLTTLTNEVTKNTEVDQSAIVLLNGLSAQIASLKNDPVALQALADQLASSSAALSAAVVANTPAA